MPALPAKVVTTSGAGDCLVAGCCWSLLKGQALSAALAHGMVSSPFMSSFMRQLEELGASMCWVASHNIMCAMSPFCAGCGTRSCE